MGCVNPDGSLTQSAKKMLEILAQAMTAEDAAVKAEKPIYLVRSKLREMIEAGLVEVNGDTYLTTDAGRQKLESSQ